VLLAFLLLVQYYIGWGRLLAPWRLLDPWLLLLAVAMVLASYGLRALRLYDYFRGGMEGAFRLAFKLMLQHNLANNLLPMRSGELAFPLLMSRLFAIPLERSLPALLWFRLFDLHTLGLLALLAIGGRWLTGLPLLLLGTVWLLLPWLLFFGNHWLLARLPDAPRGRLTGLLLKLLRGAPGRTGLLLRTWLWTLLNWLVKLGAFAWLLGLFAHISAAPALLGVIGGELTSVLPVHGIAGVGTYEAGIVAALLPTGMGGGEALAAAVNVHLFLLGVTLLGGVLSLLLGRPDGR